MRLPERIVMPDEPHIGTLGERSLHAALKDYYSQPGDLHEVEVDGYVIDIVRGEQLIEIQTRNFAAMKTKLARLTASHPVRVVHPIAAEKWIVKLGPDGRTPLERRKSPQHGTVAHIFRELVSFPHLVPRDNLTLEVALVREEEVRVNDGQGSWRRHGWSITDHRLLGVVEQRRFETVDDFRALLPASLPEPFTTRELAGALGERLYIAQKMAYCLRGMGAVEMTGKRGQAYLYVRTGR